MDKTLERETSIRNNKVYSWGMEFNYIVGPNVSPLEGLVIDKGEEKAPDM